MKNVTIEHSGFHGRNAVTIRVPDNARPGDAVQVSTDVARRINAGVCGSADCMCGECIAMQDGRGGWEVTIPQNEITGNYPQS